MKTKKDLAKYLADYLETEIQRLDESTVRDDVDIYIERGLEAFESTENCVMLFRTAIEGIDYKDS